MNIFGRDKKKEEKEARSSIIMTKETFGMVLLLFSFLSLLCLITRDLIFGRPGRWVNGFLLGMFGYYSYAVLAALIAVGVLLVAGKRVTAKKRAVISLIALQFLVVGLVHAVTSVEFGVPYKNYGKYLAGCYAAGEGGIATSTAGGLVYGIFLFPFLRLLTPVGTYIVFSLAIVLTVYYMYRLAAGKERRANRGGQSAETEGVREYPGFSESDAARADGTAAPSAAPPAPARGTRLYHGTGDFGVVGKKDADPTAGGTYSDGFRDDLTSKIDYIKTPPEYRPVPDPRSAAAPRSAEPPVVSDPIPPEKPPKYEHDGDEDGVRLSGAPRPLSFARPTPRPRPAIDPKDFYSEPDTAGSGEGEEPPAQTNVPPLSRGGERNVRAAGYPDPPRETPRDFLAPPERRPDPIPERRSDLPERRSDISDRGPDLPDPVLPEPGPEAGGNDPTIDLSVFGDRGGRRTGGGDVSRPLPPADEPNPEPADGDDEVPVVDLTSIGLKNGGGEGETPRPPSIEDMPFDAIYNAPPIELFSEPKQSSDLPEEDFELKSSKIETTLAGFSIPAKVVSLAHGPTVTRYELSMPPGISVNRVPTLQNDLAMRLESPSGVLIQAPIPGKDLLGIQVPNKVKATVTMREIMETDSFRNAKRGALMFVLGKDVVGTPVCINLAKLPHLLVAGTTGAGKSVCLNALIVSLVASHSPDELRLILVDPKRVEFSPYEHLPHLMIDDIVSTAEQAIAMLNWAIKEMEHRFDLFREEGVRDIDDYNAAIDTTTTHRMPKIVIIVDELSDLMSNNQDEIEKRLLRIAQKARAAGIHLVLATQRPSVDVITGVVKANLPAAIAFRVKSGVDSRTILDEQGAEKLLGNGDMLVKALNVFPNLERVQGAYISDDEIKRVATYIRENNTAYFDLAAAKAISVSSSGEEGESGGGGEGGGDEDRLFIDAVQSVITAGSASISMLQRRFGVGYARAGKLVDRMEQLGYISAFQGSKSRQVLITQEQFDEKYGRGD